MNNSTKKIFKILFIFMIFYMIISTYFINKISWQFFEEFLRKEKQLEYHDTGHTLGWYGPDGPLKFKSRGISDGGIFREYDVTFLDEKGNKIEYSAFEMFGIFIDLSN